MSARFTILVMVAGLACACTKRPHTPRSLAKRFQSPHPRVRKHAVGELRAHVGGPPLITIPALLRAAETERDIDIYAQIIRALGVSGVMEARPAIDRHILSPDSRLRGAARWALEKWLRRNDLLRHDDDMPKPPHPLYGPPPPLPITVPAGESLAWQLGDEEAFPEVYYQPPWPHIPWALYESDEQVTPGFTTTTGIIPSLLAPPLGSFGLGLIAAFYASEAVKEEDPEHHRMLMIPLYGPFEALSNDVDYRDGERILIIGAASLQVIGIALSSLLLLKRERVVRVRDDGGSPLLELAAGENGTMTVTW